MPTPTDALVAQLVERLNDSLKEDFEERAAIMEFDGKHCLCTAPSTGSVDNFAALASFRFFVDFAVRMLGAFDFLPRELVL